ncbi:MAG: DUF2849 domain-containing protein [Pseudomonadota bacterium]
MSKKMILTANGLRSGAVVFWTGSDWSVSVAEAITLDDPTEQKSALAAAEADTGRVVDAYLALVDQTGPTRLRERIRTSGPTITLPSGA